MEIWVTVNSYSLRSLRTLFEFSGVVLRLSFLDRDRAISGDKPHEFVRYETTTELFCSWLFSSEATDFSDENDLRERGTKILRKCKWVTESPPST